MADHMDPGQSPDRLPLPAASSLSDDQQRALAEFAEVRGYTARGPFVPLLRSPLCGAIGLFEDEVSNPGFKIPEDHRERGQVEGAVRKN